MTKKSSLEMEVNLKVLKPFVSPLEHSNYKVLINEDDKVKSMKFDSPLNDKIPFDFKVIDNDYENSREGGSLKDSLVALTSKTLSNEQDLMILNLSERYNSKINVKNFPQFNRSLLLIDPIMYQLFDQVNANGYAPFPSLKRHIGNNLKNGSTKVNNEGNSAITITMFEVLNDQIRDLLSPSTFNSKTLIAADNKDKKIEPSNVSQFYIRHPEEGINLIRKGLNSRNLSVSSKTFNSHCFIYINVFSNITPTSYNKSRLSIVDLATFKQINQLSPSEIKSINELKKNLKLLNSNELSMSCIRSFKLSKLLFYDYLNSNQYLSLVFNVDVSTDCKSILPILNSLNGKDDSQVTRASSSSSASSTLRPSVKRLLPHTTKRLGTITVSKRSDRVSKFSIVPKRSISMPGRLIINDTLSKLEKEHEQLKTELDLKKQRELELETKHETLSKDIEQYLSNIKEIETEKSVLLEEKERYEGKIFELNNKLTTTNELTNELKLEKERTHNEIENLSSELSSMNEKYLNLNLEYGNCTNKLTSQNKELIKLTKELKIEKENITKLTLTNTELSDKIESLQTQLKDLQQQIDSKENELNTIKQTSSQEIINSETLQKDLKLIKAELSSKSNELNNKVEEVSLLNEEIVNLRKRLDSEKSKSSEYINKNKNFEISIKSLRLNNMKLEEELENLKKKNKSEQSKSRSRETSIPPLINDAMIAPPPPTNEAVEIFQDPAPARISSRQSSKSPSKSPSKSSNTTTKSPAKQKTKKRKVSIVSHDIIPGDPFVDTTTKENITTTPSAQQNITMINKIQSNNLPALTTTPGLKFTPMKMSKNSSLNILSSPPVREPEPSLVKPTRSASVSPRRGKRRLRKISPNEDSEDDY